MTVVIAPDLVDLGRVLAPADRSSGFGPDNTPILQNWLDSLVTIAGNGVIGLIPAGVYKFDGTVFIHAPNVTLRGAGRKDTSLIGSTWKPLLVTHPPSAWVDPLTRPYVAGVLDNSVSGRGFATLGRYGAIGLRNCSTLGRRRHDQGGTTFDGFRTLAGLCLEICFSPGPKGIQPGQPIMGIGADGDPWGFYRAGDGEYSFSFSCTDPHDKRCPRYNHNVVFNLDGFTPPFDVRASVDLTSWTAEVTCNGQIVSRSILGQPRPGAPLRWAKAGDPFCLGFAGAGLPRGNGATDVVIYAARLSGRARGEPTSGLDVDRYQGLRDPDVMWYLPLTGEAGLTLDLQGGGANDCQYASLLVLDGATPLRGVVGVRLEDLSIKQASPGLVIGQSLDVEISRCDLIEGSCGIESLRTGAAYPIRLTDCRLSGYDCAASFCETSATLTRTDVITFGGPVGVQGRAANLVWPDGNIWFPGGQTEHEVDMRAGEYGGNTNVARLRSGIGRPADAPMFGGLVFIPGLTVDDEDGGAICHNANFRIEQQADCPNQVRISDPYVFRNAPDAVVIDLVGSPPQKVRWATPLVEATGLMVGGDMANVVRVSGDWHGEIDARQCLASGIDATGPHHLVVKTLDGSTPPPPIDPPPPPPPPQPDPDVAWWGRVEVAEFLAGHAAAQPKAKS